MTTQDKIENIRKMPEVHSINVWNNKRAYINLTACDKSFAGNRSHQFYVDMASGEIVDKMGKGITSRAFDAQRVAVSDAWKA